MGLDLDGDTEKPGGKTKHHDKGKRHKHSHDGEKAEENGRVAASSEAIGQSTGQEVVIDSPRGVGAASIGSVALSDLETSEQSGHNPRIDEEVARVALGCLLVLSDYTGETDPNPARYFDIRDDGNTIIVRNNPQQT